MLRVSIDAGTSFYKVASNTGFSIIMPSISAKVDSYRNLRYKGGRGKVTFQGECFQVGNDVINYNPKLYNVANYPMLNIMVGITYALPVSWEGGSIELLLTQPKKESVPNVQKPFEITLDNRPYYFIISPVSIYTPGFGSYHYFRSKFTQFSSGATIVLDVGHTSTSMLIFDNCTDEVLSNPLVIEGGVGTLLDLIRKDPDFRTHNQGIELPMKTLMYKPVNHLDETSRTYVKAWWLNIINAVVGIFDLKEYEVTNILITGGGCTFLHPLFSNDIHINGIRFQLCPDYRMSEVYGNLLYKEKRCPTN